MATCSGEFAPEYADRIAMIADISPRTADFLEVLTPDQLARLQRYDEPFGPADLPDVAARDEVVTGPHGPVPVRIYHRHETAAAPRPALVWMHGGAFFFGDLDMPEADHVSRVLAHDGDAVVVSVDYRLVTPEVFYPVPHEDCLAAYEWVREHADELGVDPARIAVGGGSAGANLAAGLALHLRDLDAAPWQALLAYPIVHGILPEPSEELAACLAKVPPVLLISPDLSINENYAGGPIDTATPYAFPALAEDLTGFPPTFIDNDEFDSLRASGEAFAEQLQAAGCAVEVRTTCGVPHGHLNAVGSVVTAQSLERYAERLRGDF